MPGLIGEIAELFAKSGVDLARAGLAWARVAPSVALIPAFGLRAFPAPARAVLGLGLALSIAPGFAPPSGAWPVALLSEVGKGLPIALGAAASLWAATMAGGVIDDLRGARESSGLPNVEAGASPLGSLFALLAGIAFLEGGGPARVLSALSRPDLDFASPWTRAVANLTSGVELSLAVATPLIVTALVVEVASSLVARAASPSYIQPLLAPLRSLTILAVLALVLERMLELLSIMALRA
ncbi:MAG: flagellar biosynthetic protein FliR [Polyangiaceae bacterium]